MKDWKLAGTVSFGKQYRKLHVTLPNGLSFYVFAEHDKMADVEKFIWGETDIDPTEPEQSND